MTAPIQELLLAQPSATPTVTAVDRDATPPDDNRWLPLLQRLETLGWIQPGERLTRTEPAGAGNMNRTLRIELARGSNKRSLVLKQALPYVARYPDIAAPVERGAVEAAFYKAVATVPAVAGAMPELLGFDATAHLLALEDLGSARDFSALYDLSSDEQRTRWRTALPTIVDWLVALHTQAPSSDAPTNDAMRRLNHEHIFLIPFGNAPAVPVTQNLAALHTRLSTQPALRDRLTRLGDLYLGTVPANTTQAPVLLHGDFYPGSWLLDNADKPHIIDPEFSFVGPAEFDLGVMRAHLALAGESDSTWNRLLQRYAHQRAIDESLLEDFAATEILRRCYGVAQLPLSLDEPEIHTLCTRAFQTLAR